MGFFLTDKSPVIWRGPMVMGAVRQFLKDTLWGTQDFLIVDLPPGTGDAQLTLAQQVALDGAVIVTTPQDVALLDATRAARMLHQLHCPVIGVVENMSYFVCPDCGERDELFGAGGGAKLAMEEGTAGADADSHPRRGARGGRRGDADRAEGPRASREPRLHGACARRAGGDAQGLGGISATQRCLTYAAALAPIDRRR